MFCRLVAAYCLLWCSPAFAMVGDAPPMGDAALARQVVLIVGSHGSYCSGTVLAPDLVLTAAHCVPAGADYKLVDHDAARRPVLKDIVRIVRHPQYQAAAMTRHRATADLALLRLAAPLGAAHAPAALGAMTDKVKPGDAFLVVGYGVTRERDVRSGGTLRSARLVATGHPGNLQLRLVDPATRGERAGLGACTGDSGAPVFQATGAALALIGVVSWSTGPGMTAGCGGLTGVTPLSLYRGWIVTTARKLGASLR